MDRTLPAPPRTLDRIDGWVIAAAILLLFASALPWIASLGMEYDEAHFLESATRIVAGHSERLEPPDGIYLFDRPFMFMTMAYVGALDGWLLAIPLKLFGFHQTVSRVAHLCAGALVLALAYVLAKRLGGRPAAMIAVSLLLVDLEFLIHVPVHFGPFLVQMISGLMMAWLVDRWLAGEPDRLFYWACFWAGLAFQEKLTFVWFLALYVVALLLFRGRDVFRRLSARSFTVGLAIFLLAMLPVLWYTFGRPEVVLGFGKSAAKAPAGPEVLAERFRQWHTLLSGQDFFRLQVGEPGVGRFSAVPWIFWAAMVGALVMRVRPALMFLGMTLGMVALNALFPEGGRLHHLLLIYPFPQIAAGLVVARTRWMTVAAAVLILATGVSTAQNLAWYTQEIQRTGGHNHWSSAIYDLAAWMRAEPEKLYLASAWGFYRPLYTLTGGEISIRDRYFELLPEPLPPELQTEMTNLVRRRDSYWLTSNIQPQYARNFAKLTELAAPLGLKPRRVKVFYRRTGEPIYEVYSFHDDTGTPWRPVASEVQPSPVVTVALPPGAREVRFRLPEGHSRIADALTVELLDSDGQRLRAWWRTIEYFPIIRPRAWLAFGPDLFPDNFVPLEGARDGEVRGLRLTVESRRGPSAIRPADIAVR